MAWICDGCATNNDDGSAQCLVCGGLRPVQGMAAESAVPRVPLVRSSEWPAPQEDARRSANEVPPASSTVLTSPPPVGRRPVGVVAAAILVVLVVTVGAVVLATRTRNSSGTTTTSAESVTSSAARGGSSETDQTTTTSRAVVANGGRTDADGVLSIGVVLPQSGALATLGPAMIGGARMAVRDINAAGGVNGRDVVLTVRDDGGASDDSVALSSVDELIDDANVDGIVGAAGSGTTKVILDRVISSGTVECSPSNTGIDLSKADDQGLYFRTPPPDNLQAEALANAVTDDGHQNVAIIAQNSDYGAGFVRYLGPTLSSAGARVVTDVAYDPDGTSFSADVQKVVDAEPDAVVVVGYPVDGGAVLKEMIGQGIGPRQVSVYVTDGMQSNVLYQQIDPLDPTVTAGIKGTAASAAPEAGAVFFADAFRSFAPDVISPIYSAQAYDCVMLMALAAQKERIDAPAAIAGAMVNVSGGGTTDGETCGTYAECSALLEASRDIDYQGASGVLDFTDVGEPSTGSFDIYSFQSSGETETVRQVVVSSR